MTVPIPLKRYSIGDPRPTGQRDASVFRTGLTHRRNLETRPATTSHSGMSPEDRQALGISDSLIRVSVGLEATEDLIEDFELALKA